MSKMTADQFLQIVFDQCEGVVVTCNAEEGFKARRWRPGKALKGAVYWCISTVADTAPRDDVLNRQAVNLVKTYAIGLDDIGTKVDRKLFKGKLPPTFKFRTSMPGGVSNEQWFFVFAEGVPPDRAAALVEALAQAKLTDAGARRADRIMRLPGSLNEKYSPPFATVVLEAHPDRLYTFSEVCAGLGVTPSDTPALPTGPMALPDGMIDPIDAWNHDHDRVTGPLNARGWYPVTCPLEHEHTGQVDHGADYKPGLPGIFKCQHEHKGREPLTTAWYRAWILEQDPGADLSLVPRQALQELGGKLAAALGLKPPPASSRVSTDGIGPPSDGRLHQDQPSLSQEAFKALQDQIAAGGMFDPSKRPVDLGEAILADLVKVDIENAFWSIEGKCLLKHVAVDDKLFALMDREHMLDRHNAEGELLVSKLRPSKWVTSQMDMQRVSRITHRLGEALIVDDCLNIAAPLPPRLTVEGEPEPWLDLISFVCRDIAADVELVLDWMALVVTDWIEKPGWHLMFKGEHGTGKNLAVRPLVKYTAPDHWDKLTESDIAGQFTTHLTKRVVQIDELKMQTRGALSPTDIYNKIKGWTARDTPLLMINDKNVKRYSAANRSCWIITSNAAIPLPLEEGDRRFMVVETPRAPWPEEDYQEIVDWLEAGGDEMVISWLHRRWDALSAARRKALFGRAPSTDAKLDLVEASAEGIDGAIKLAVGGRHGYTWPDLMSIDDVIARLKRADFTLLTEQLKRQINDQRIWPALRAAGAVKLFKEAVRDGDKSVRLWCMRASKAHSYEALGPTKELHDIYLKQRAGVVPGGFVRVLKSEESTK